MKQRYKDISGQTFGRLTAIKPVGKNKRNSYEWLCVCTCGGNKIVDGNCLRMGKLNHAAVQTTKRIFYAQIEKYTGTGERAFIVFGKP